MKRASCEQRIPPTKKSKRKVEYDIRWKTELPWHRHVYAEDSNTESGVTGLFCSLCQHHGTTQWNSCGTWTSKPCTCLRKDLLQRHKASKMHKDAEQCEAQRLASRRDGGIIQAFSVCMSLNRKALVEALKTMYWLAKGEIALTTTLP